MLWKNKKKPTWVEAASLPLSVINQYHYDLTGEPAIRESEAKPYKKKRKVEVQVIDVETIKKSSKSEPAKKKRKTNTPVPEKKDRLERRGVFRGNYDEDQVRSHFSN